MSILTALQMSPARALAETPPPPNREKLMEIARQFVAKIGQDLKTADEHMAEKIAPEDLRMQKYFEALPEGEPLILQISLGGTRFQDRGKISIDQPVMAIKEGHDVMISLSDFVTAASFPIKIDADKGTADGWFIRENQPFHLDLNARKVTVLDKTSAIAPDEARIDGGDILVRGKTVSRWFGFQMLANPQAQRLEVTAEQPWPLQEKIERIRRQASITQKLPPKNPRMEQEYKAATVPNADVTLRSLYTKTDSGQTTKRTAWSVNGAGDLAGHQSRAYLSGSDQDIIDNIRFSLSRTTDEPELLGPLKARFYEFNDIRTVNVPLAGSAPSERGIHITNRDPNMTYDTATLIDGFADPDWDVELYRGPQYIDAQTVGIDGRYAFENVQLFAGENRFRIIKYGPQGEIREEDRVMTVAPGAYGTSGLYDVSLSQQNTQTYTVNPSSDEDRNSPHIAATYEKQITDTLALRGGLNARQQGGKEIAYVSGGAFTTLDNTIINTDIVGTTENTYMGALTARRNFGRHSASAAAQIKGEGFSTDSVVGSPSPSLYSLTGQLTGPLVASKRGGPTYGLSSGLIYRGTNTTTLSAGLNLAGRVQNLYLSNSLGYNHSSNSNDGDNLSGTLAVRGRAQGASLRSTLAYKIMPEMTFTDLRIGASRNLSKDVQADVGVLHKLDRQYSQADVSLSWTTDHATFSPSLSYDTDNAVSAMVSARFGLSYNPYSGDIIMKSRNLSDAGGIAAFVFLDKDGDGKFSTGDEPLPDVLVKAVQVSKTADTDEKGEAFLYDLPTNRVTDIAIEENSSFDPAWVSGFPGISLRPRAGDITRVDFPILQGAEMDGTAWVQDDKGNRTEARNVRLVLNTPDGKVARESTTPYDGYFVLSGIRPGVYYLTSDTEMSPVTAYLPPRKIVIGPEGATLYGQNLTLYKGYNIPVSFRSDTPSPASDVRRSRILRPTDIAAEDVTFRLGPYSSRLRMAFDWYRLKIRNRELGKYFSLATPLDEIRRDATTAALSLPLRSKNPLRPEDAAAICKQFIDRDFKCAVDVNTRFKDALPTAEAPEKAEKDGKS